MNPIYKLLVKEEKEAKEDRATTAVAWDILLVTVPPLQNHVSLEKLEEEKLEVEKLEAEKVFRAQYLGAGRKATVRTTVGSSIQKRDQRKSRA